MEKQHTQQMLKAFLMIGEGDGAKRKNHSSKSGYFAEKAAQFDANSPNQ